MSEKPFDRFNLDELWQYAVSLEADRDKLAQEVERLKVDNRKLRIKESEILTENDSIAFVANMDRQRAERAEKQLKEVKSELDETRKSNGKHMIQFVQAEKQARELAEALKETSTLFFSLRRTIDKDHWFASDLDHIGRVSNKVLAAYQSQAR